jgi:drug/metabolite transporter (DMT)-like permease
VEYALGVAAAVLLGMSFVLQQSAAQQIPAGDLFRLRLVADLLGSKKWLAGLVTMVAGQLLSGWVVGHLVLAVYEPLLATNLLVALALAWPLSGQALRLSEILGAIVLLAGVTALSVAQSVSSADDIVGSPAYWPACGAAIALAAAGFAQAGRRRAERARAMLFGTAAGLTFGIQDAVTRRTVEALTGPQHVAALLTSWPPYVMVAVAVAGLWLMQNAFNAAPLHASLPAMTAAEPVAGIVLGIVAFREKVPVAPGMIAVQVAGLVALIAGVVVVAQAPALSSLSPHHQPGTVPREDKPRAELRSHPPSPGG